MDGRRPHQLCHTVTRLSVVVLFLTLHTPVAVSGYLLGQNDTATFCWTTEQGSGITVFAGECASSVRVAFLDPPPAVLYHEESFTVRYSVFSSLNVTSNPAVTHVRICWQNHASI